MADIESLTANVRDAQKNLRSAMRAYRRATGQPASSVLQDSVPINHINPHLLEDTVVVSAREYLLPYVPAGGAACEVGTSTGFFARAIARFVQPTELHVIDADFSRFQQDRYDQVAKDTPLIKHEGWSWEQLAKFENYFDFIYIDAGHTYADVKRDVEAAIKALKPNGYLMFNDYTRWSIELVVFYGVMAVVNETANNLGWAFRGVALSGSGHFDVLLSKDTPEMDEVHRLRKEAVRLAPPIVPAAKEKFVPQTVKE